MPVPTPPKQNLLKVTPKEKTPKKINRGPSKNTQKLSSDIRQATEAIKDDKNTVDILSDADRITKALENLVSPIFRMSTLVPEEPTPRNKPVFKAPEHLMTNPFKDNPHMQELAKKLENDTTKRPIKRQPRRKPAGKTQEK